MIYIYMKPKSGDVLIHLGGFPATAAGLGHSKLNNQRLAQFVRGTIVTAEGNVADAFQQIIAQFTDAYIDRFLPSDDSLVSLRQILERAEGDTGQMDIGGGVGRVALEWRMWADEDEPVHVRLVHITGSGNRGVMWEYTSDDDRLDVAEATWALAGALRSGALRNTRIITDREVREHAKRVALDAIGCTCE